MALLPDDLAYKLRFSRAEMQEPEKALLYSLILGLQPQTVLEIGTFAGGSAQIILWALEWLEHGGQLYSIDPEPQGMANAGFEAIAPGVLRRGYWTLARGRSPDALPELAKLANAPFDFVLVDGDHSKRSVIADVEGVLPYLADDAYLLFHDAYAPGVEDAIEYLIGRYAEGTDIIRLIDCGILCKTPVYLEHMGTNYYGMRLVRFERG